MLPVEVPLSQLGPPVLLLQLLLPPISAFFPNIWSLLAAPGSITHQDLTEEAALNVTLELFLEEPPPGRPHLRLGDYRVSTPVSSPTLCFPKFWDYRHALPHPLRKLPPSLPSSLHLPASLSPGPHTAKTSIP